MRRGYIRLSKVGASLQEQEDALRKAGIEDFSPDGPVHVDTSSEGKGDNHLPQRELAIRSLREGDVLVIADASCLGTSVTDVLGAMVRIGHQSAAIHDAAEKETIQLFPGLANILAFAERAENLNKRAITTRMRQRKVAMGVKGGAPSKIPEDRLQTARTLWFDPSKSASEVATETGISARTLYRKFGNRSDPSN